MYASLIIIISFIFLLFIDSRIKMQIDILSKLSNFTVIQSHHNQSTLAVVQGNCSTACFMICERPLRWVNMKNDVCHNSYAVI